MLSFVNGQVLIGERRSDPPIVGTVLKFPWATMTQPIVGVPFNPATPADANIVAVGAGHDGVRLG